MAESNLAFSPSPSTSLAGLIKLHNESVWFFSKIGNWIIMPEMLSSWLADLILVAISVGFLAKKSSTSTPMSCPYCFLRATYLVMTGLLLSRIMRSLGFLFMEATWWAWRSLINPASSLPFRIFIIEFPLVLVRANSRIYHRLY